MLPNAFIPPGIPPQFMRPAVPGPGPGPGPAQFTDQPIRVPLPQRPVQMMPGPQVPMPPAYYGQMMQNFQGMPPYQAGAAAAASLGLPSRSGSPTPSVGSYGSGSGSVQDKLTFQQLVQQQQQQQQHDPESVQRAGGEVGKEVDEDQVQEEIAKLTRQFNTVSERLTHLNDQRKQILEEKKRIEEKLTEDMSLMDVGEIQINPTRVLERQEREPGLPSLNRKKLQLCLRAYFGNDLHAQHCMTFIEQGLAEMDQKEKKKKNVLRLVDIGQKRRGRSLAI